MWELKKQINNDVFESVNPSMNGGNLLQEHVSQELYDEPFQGSILSKDEEQLVKMSKLNKYNTLKSKKTFQVKRKRNQMNDILRGVETAASQYNSHHRPTVTEIPTFDRESKNSLKMNTIHQPKDSIKIEDNFDNPLDIM